VLLLVRCELRVLGQLSSFCRVRRSLACSPAVLFSVPSSRLVVVLSAVLFLVAIVAGASSFGGPKRNSLDEAEDYLRVPKRLANLAADHDDRDGLANIMREGRAEAQRDADVDRKKQQLHNSRPSFSRRSSVPKVDAEKVAEQHARILNDRDERAMMSTEKMVPWVHWPKGDDDMGSGKPPLFTEDIYKKNFEFGLR
jgi:hypothetical protein